MSKLGNWTAATLIAIVVTATGCCGGGFCSTRFHGSPPPIDGPMPRADHEMPKGFTTWHDRHAPAEPLLRPPSRFLPVPTKPVFAPQPTRLEPTPAQRPVNRGEGPAPVEAPADTYDGAAPATTQADRSVDSHVAQSSPARPRLASAVRQTSTRDRSGKRSARPVRHAEEWGRVSTRIPSGRTTIRFLR